ncbi:hypothetical protein F4781DRAFT_434457 [Annulohypoxylon bovei var. microspora]|nr:hypothetical protein F4781DRAFT_434457 [Annulohypoxylon bovei var. microspora]
MSKFAKWRMELISIDEEGCHFYIDHYKPFRLGALKQYPDAFGSTYDREINFTNDDWLSRIKNPLAKTFVAVRTLDGRVLSATSLIGPMPNPDPSSNPLQASTEMRDGSDQHHNHGNTQVSPLSFQISAVYTTPEARGQGLAKALVKTASEQAIGSAKGQERQLSLSLVVSASNSAAIGLYTSCGFVVDEGGPRTSFNPHKNLPSDELRSSLHAPPVAGLAVYPNQLRTAPYLRGLGILSKEAAWHAPKPTEIILWQVDDPSSRCFILANSPAREDDPGNLLPTTGLAAEPYILYIWTTRTVKSRVVGFVLIKHSTLFASSFFFT